MELSERKALQAYASMVNTLRVEELEQYLAEDFVYESQMVLTPLKSKSEFLSYMRPKLETIRKSGATAYAEMGEIHAYGALRPCVILAQHSKDNLIGIVLAKIRDNKISRLDLCIIPPPEQATRSGEYPGRKTDVMRKAKQNKDGYMNSSINDFVERINKGDRDAVRELFDFGRQLEGEGKFQEAAEAFREVAITYRIWASRNQTFAEDAESRAMWSATVRNIYKKWIEDNPTGPVPLPYRVPGVTASQILNVVSQLFDEDSLAPILRFLEESLIATGVQFFSPGGTFERYLLGLMQEVFGLHEYHNYYEPELKNTAVRIGVDIIANEVIQRCLGLRRGPSKLVPEK